ncbi:MAG: DUF3168 domain-containing protein [Deltaproteobacteria bacterium]
MSASNEFQAAIVARLKTFSGLTALIAGRVYDNKPPSPVFPYISLGPADVVPAHSTCIPARDHTRQIDIWARQQGRKVVANDILDQVSLALDGYSTDIGTNALVAIEVVVAHVIDDPDGVTAHAVVHVTARIEER